MSRTPKYETIEVNTNRDICTIALNRPGRRNAITEQLMLDIIAAIEDINNNKEIRVVIIKGNGPDFCAGFDFQYFDDSVTPEEVSRVVDLGCKFKNMIINMRAITIACIDGNSVGGGVVIALACDFRYATKDSVFWLPETKLGIPLAFGSMPMLSDGMTRAQAMEFVLLGSKMYAADLFRSGLLNKVFDNKNDLERQVQLTSEQINNLPALVADITKKQILASWEDKLRSAYEFTDSVLLHAGLIDSDSNAKRRAFVHSIQAKRVG